MKGPSDVCSKHKRQMTGFSTLFCPDCESERNSGVAFDDGINRNSLDKQPQGSINTMTGRVASYMDLRDKDDAGKIVRYIAGDLVYKTKLFRFVVVGDKLVKRFLSHGPSGKQLTITGEVRHNVQHVDQMCSDVLVNELRFTS